MKLLQGNRKVCPHCGDWDTRLSRQRKLLDYFLMAFLFWPYRCRTCYRRFWGLTLMSSRQDKQAAPSSSDVEIPSFPGSTSESEKTPS